MERNISKKDHVFAGQGEPVLAGENIAVTTMT